MIGGALLHLGYDSDKDFLCQDNSDGQGVFLRRWKSDKPQPSDEEIVATMSEVYGIGREEAAAYVANSWKVAAANEERLAVETLARAERKAAMKEAQAKADAEAAATQLAFDAAAAAMAKAAAFERAMMVAIIDEQIKVIAELRALIT